MHVCDPRAETREYFQARADIDRALQHVSWYDLGQDHGQLELRLSGSPTFYFDRQQAPAFADGDCFGPGSPFWGCTFSVEPDLTFRRVR